MRLSKKPLFWKFLRLALTLLILTLIAGFITSNWKDFSKVFEIGWLNFLALVFALILIFISSSARFTCIYRAIGAPIGYIESFGLFMASGVLNFILPAQSGTAARAVYLKDRYQIPYSQAPSIILGGLVITFFVGGFLLLLISLFYMLIGQPPPSFLWIIGALFTLSVTLLWVRIPKRLTKKLGRIGNMLDLFFEGIRLFRSHRKAFVEAIFWQGAEFLSSGAAFLVAFNSLGEGKFDLLAGVSFAVFSSLLNTVFITPGNIGVLEAAVGFISQIYDFSFISGVTATALVHGGGYLVYFILAPISWYFLFFRKRKIHPGTSS